MEHLTISSKTDISFSNIEDDSDFAYCVIQSSFSDCNSNMSITNYLHIPTNTLKPIYLDTKIDLENTNKLVKYAIIHKFFVIEPGVAQCDVEFVDIEKYSDLPLIKNKEHCYENGRFTMNFTY